MSTEAAWSVIIGTGAVTAVWVMVEAYLTRGKVRRDADDVLREALLLDHRTPHWSEAPETEEQRLERRYREVMEISLEPREIQPVPNDTDRLIQRIDRELHNIEWDRIGQKDRQAGRPPRGIATYSQGGITR